MNNFMKWMTDSFAPKVNKISKNPWVASVQDSILAAMPMIFIGSFASILSIAKTYWKVLPDFSPLSSFSFGLFSLFLSYLLPEAIMNHKGHKDVAKQAGIGGIAFFLMMIYPTYNQAGDMILNPNLLGTGGMLTALVAGLFVGFVMNLASKYQLFGDDSGLPDFVTVWFNTLIPILVILLVGWISTFVLKFNLSTGVTTLLTPLINIGGSFIGFVIIVFLGYSFLYSFGMSSWITYQIEMAIALPFIAENAKAAAAGQPIPHIFVEETIGIFTLGGGGATLALCIMMTFIAKSSRMKLVGRAAIIPSIFNINEPVVFGAPIAFNPLLMIPMWTMGLLGPILTWIVMKIGLVPIPSHVFGLWYLPGPIFSYFAISSWRGAVYSLIIFAISWAVYWPFFKVYDRQELAKQNSAAD